MWVLSVGLHNHTTWLSVAGVLRQFVVWIAIYAFELDAVLALAGGPR